MLDEGGAPEWRNIKTMRIGSNRLNINTRMIVGNAIRMTVCMFFMLFASLLITGKPCLSAQKRHAQETAVHKHNVQKGKASYYSKRATGARSASGERIHHDSLTCAHKKYPFGTILRVTNLSNNKSVDVRVTDRGPYGRGRVIDLSYAAAKAIGMLAQGVAMVEVKPVTEKIVPYRMEEDDMPEFEFEFVKPDEYKVAEREKKK